MDDRPAIPPRTIQPPSESTLTGKYVQLRRLSPSDAPALFETIAGSSPAQQAGFNYMPDGPFTDQTLWTEYITRRSESQDPLFFTVIDLTSQRLVGYMSYMRIDRANRSVEIGHILFSPLVQRSRVTTEAVYLMLRAAFAQGYRRVEWKCDEGNGPSKRAAARFGFVFEGLFRCHMIVKDRNRDTAWFSIVEGEWEPRHKAFEAWLDEDNFEEGTGLQRKGLAEFMMLNGVSTASGQSS